MSVTITLKDLKVNQVVNRICHSNDVGMFVSETCARYMNDFVPMYLGALSQNYTTDPFKVTYNQVYAHRQYNGDGFKFSKEMHPNATAHWDRAMMQSKKTQLANEVTAYLKSK